VLLDRVLRGPLTQLAEDLGAPDGSVTDIWLPRWFARNPLITAAENLNGHNLGERQRLHGQASRHRASSVLLILGRTNALLADVDVCAAARTAEFANRIRPDRVLAGSGG
jgi:hypothetical protein